MNESPGNKITLDGTQEHPGTEMRASIQNDDLVIHIPLDLLVWSQENRESAELVINNKKAMAAYLKNRILSSRYDSETGSSSIERMIDDCFDEAYEDGERWIDERNTLAAEDKK